MEDLSAHYSRMGRPIPEETKTVLSSLGLQAHLRQPRKGSPGESKVSEIPETAQTVSEVLAALAAKKRKGVEVGPILASLKAPLVYAVATPQPTLSLWFDGARLLTVNELFSILQYRKHQTYAYKKAWRQLIHRALEGMEGPRPFFDGPTRIWLYRRGKGLVDLDSLPPMFKYAIDALRREGIIADDNPQIIVEPKLLQEKGLPAVGMRLERLWDWTHADLTNLKQQWLEPPQGTP